MNVVEGFKTIRETRGLWYQAAATGFRSEDP
jgi:hypothetical protein